MEASLLSVHQFIKQLKEEQNGDLGKYAKFTEVSKKQLTTDLFKLAFPVSESPIQKFIHGDIFEYSVQQAAGHASAKDNNPWIRFGDLYSDIKPKEKKQYHRFMETAGSSAWEIFEKNVRKVYSRKSKNIQYEFGYHIWNNTFPFLTKKLEADMFVSSYPNVVCDIKYSTMKKHLYEQEYLVHAIIQVLIYSLALNLEPETLQLRVLVFFSKTAEAVLYESDIHKNKALVKKLYKRLNGKRSNGEVTYEGATKLTAVGGIENHGDHVPGEELTDDDDIVQQVETFHLRNTTNSKTLRKRKNIKEIHPDYRWLHLCIVILLSSVMIALIIKLVL